MQTRHSRRCGGASMRAAAACLALLLIGQQAHVCRRLVWALSITQAKMAKIGVVLANSTQVLEARRAGKC